MVDGVLASDQSSWLLDDIVPAAWARHLPALYEAIMAPLRWVYSAAGPKALEALDAVLGIQWIGHRVPLVFAHLPTVLCGVAAAKVLRGLMQLRLPPAV